MLSRWLELRNERQGIKRTSLLLILIVAVMLILSLTALYTAAEIYLQGGEEILVYYVAVGLLGVGISLYMLRMGRKRPFTFLSDEKVNTLLVCEKCEFKSIREFKQGDYVFKKVDECPKCKGEMTITAIYRESKEKEREWKI
ncbi:MAG: hypothetical protein QXL67_04295 [Candidatus Bathyarchaeia archaeon]